MNILVGEHEKEALLQFIAEIKPSYQSWQIAEIRLSEEAVQSLGIRHAARLIHRQFSKANGKLVICNHQELFMLINMECKLPKHKITTQTQEALGNFDCEVFVDDLSIEGLCKLEILIQGPRSAPALCMDISLPERRRRRIYNLVYIADDDFFIRSLIEKSFKNRAVIKHFTDGCSVVSAYSDEAPDMVLLDFHLPDKKGGIILQELREIDPDAYIVMLSADSSKDNVLNTAQLGAKGFLPKPFTLKRLMEYYQQCPTVA